MGNAALEGGASWKDRMSYFCRQSLWNATDKIQACLKGVIGDLNGAGELGESVYGEKADIMGPVGDGNMGDLATAVIVVCRRVR